MCFGFKKSQSRTDPLQEPSRPLGGSSLFFEVFKNFFFNLLWHATKFFVKSSASNIRSGVYRPEHTQQPRFKTLFSFQTFDIEPRVLDPSP